MPQRRHARVTQRTLAQHLGIGQKIVSRSFSEPHLVNAELRSRILLAAEELGYVSSRDARVTSRGRLESVLLVQTTKDASSPMPEQMIAGINDELAQSGARLTQVRLADEQLMDPRTIKRLVRDLLVDGLLMNYELDVPPALQDIIRHLGLPAIWINHREAEASVRPDDLAAGQAATQHLLDLGHQRIMYADFYIDYGPIIHSSKKDRLTGYRTAIALAGVSQIEALPDHEVEPLAYAREVLTRYRPTAVLAYGGFETSTLALAAMSLGLRIPQDLSLATFGPNRFFCGVSITTWCVPLAEMGHVAVRQLLAVVHDPTTQVHPLVLPFARLDGETVGAPPRTDCLNRQ